MRKTKTGSNGTNYQHINVNRIQMISNKNIPTNLDGEDIPEQWRNYWIGFGVKNSSRHQMDRCNPLVIYWLFAQQHKY